MAIIIIDGFDLDERPDPNEGNPFEPPETPEQRARRIGQLIRKRVDSDRKRVDSDRDPVD